MEETTVTTIVTVLGLIVATASVLAIVFIIYALTLSVVEDRLQGRLHRLGLLGRFYAFVFVRSRIRNGWTLFGTRVGIRRGLMYADEKYPGVDKAAPRRERRQRELDEEITAALDAQSLRNDKV